MKTLNLVIYFLLALIIAFAMSIYFHYRSGEVTVSDPVIFETHEEPVKRPVVRYPVPDTPTVAQPATIDPLQIDETKEPQDTHPLAGMPDELPPIEESDTLVNEALTGLLTNREFKEVVIVDSFIQRLVLTINNLPEKKLPLAHVPFELPEGTFIATGDDENPRISSENYQRYAPYLYLLENINPDALIKTYVYLYPLMQSAYRQLGYPTAYFNDRLVYVIEHLLETPNPDDPLLLERPSVLYTYANPEFENLSAGQKILLRMGTDQRSRAKSVLRNYHFRLTRLLP